MWLILKEGNTLLSYICIRGVFKKSSVRLAGLEVLGELESSGVQSFQYLQRH